MPSELLSSLLFLVSDRFHQPAEVVNFYGQTSPCQPTNTAATPATTSGKNFSRLKLSPQRSARSARKPKPNASSAPAVASSSRDRAFTKPTTAAITTKRELMRPRRRAKVLRPRLPKKGLQIREARIPGSRRKASEQIHPRQLAANLRPCTFEELPESLAACVAEIDYLRNDGPSNGMSLPSTARICELVSESPNRSKSLNDQTTFLSRFTSIS